MITSLSGIAHVELLRGPEAPVDALPDLLIEVPHGADRRTHYDALAARLKGPLPDQLEHFFFVNTDVGAWQLGRWVAEAVLRQQPHRTVRLIRCLIPRTFIDTNRKPDVGGGDITKGAMTPGLQPYIHDPADQALLRALHAQYTALVDAAMAETCGNGGIAFVPHTYGPVTMGIARVDDRIVENLHWALAPERADTWPLRPEVDIIHATEDGTSLAPPGTVDRLAQTLRDDGVQVELGGTYFLHPSTMGFVWCDRYPGQVLSLEVRRDLLVDIYTPFDEMEVLDERLARYGAPMAAVLCDAMDDRAP